MGKVSIPKGAVSVLGVTPSAPTAAVRPVKAVDSAEPTDEPDLRLIIEESEETGGVIYLVVDRRSGKVVSRLSREEVLKLKEKAGYTAGEVFSSKV